MNSLTIRLPAPYTESIILESGMTMKKVPLADYQAMEAQSAEWRVKAAALDKELQAARDDAKHLREQLDKQQAETRLPDPGAGRAAQPERYAPPSGGTAPAGGRGSPPGEIRLRALSARHFQDLRHGL